ncbi:DivIVA domain-containing protein [Lapillicoccus sp.]|uniref:DivIVA domain-containing protein n=1 Tax=Lapillicoccus sp. TaxID=1909287 RepID=UPI0025E660C2|nr:DivIVA domain-containing protein [Lapillicoccus sp.]
MIWLVLVVAVVLVVLTTAAVLGRVDGSLDAATTSLSHEPLPQTPLTPGDFAELHFDTALRGYRMNQVDGVVDRLRREVADLGDEVARLRRATERQPGPADGLEHAEQPQQPQQPQQPDQPQQLVSETPASLSDRS